jgi:hypothetical protein
MLSVRLVDARSVFLRAGLSDPAANTQYVFERRTDPPQ